MAENYQHSKVNKYLVNKIFDMDEHYGHAKVNKYLVKWTRKYLDRRAVEWSIGQHTRPLLRQSSSKPTEVYSFYSLKLLKKHKNFVLIRKELRTKYLNAWKMCTFFPCLGFELFEARIRFPVYFAFSPYSTGISKIGVHFGSDLKSSYSLNSIKKITQPFLNLKSL